MKPAPAILAPRLPARPLPVALTTARLVGFAGLLSDIRLSDARRPPTLGAARPPTSHLAPHDPLQLRSELLPPCSEHGRGQPLARSEPDGNGDAPPDQVDLLDPLTRALSGPPPLQPPALAVVVDDASHTTRMRAASVEDLFGALVRKAAWSLGADRRSATLRLEFGAGPLQGSALTICADPHGLQVVLDSPSNVDVEVWKNRLRRRLASMGLEASFP